MGTSTLFSTPTSFEIQHCIMACGKNRKEDGYLPGNWIIQENLGGIRRLASKQMFGTPSKAILGDFDLFCVR